MTSNMHTVLNRNCDVIEIPSGRASTLPQGMSLRIMQSRGDSYTVWTDYGQMYRVEGKDADALGLEAESGTAQAEDAREFNEQMVWDILKTVYDPEIPVNIVDLGLVYGMEIKDRGDGSHKVEVKMTLTAQGCGMGGSIAFDARQKLMGLPGVSEADVDLVWDPPWNPQMISPEGRERLGLD